MSFVGPRPLLVEYLGMYTTRQARRHEVRPGITGWAQVNGRNALTWEQKFDLDVWYVDHRSFLLDLKILLNTLPAALRREWIWARGETNEPFLGSAPERTKRVQGGRGPIPLGERASLTRTDMVEQPCKS
jgi:hypothetical protein